MNIFKNILKYVFLFFIILSFDSCAQKEIVKYKYIERPLPELKTVPLKDLNLSDDKKFKLHIKIKKNN